MWLDETGLLTRDAIYSVCAFLPRWAVAFHRLQRSLTVAGQWRFFTALPVHLVSKFCSFSFFLRTRIRYLFGLKYLAETGA